jgi:GT2 family glycosyltransferase
MLVTAVPFDVERNLGRAYNQTMARLLPGDWLCGIDHDVAFTTKDWFPQLLTAIESKPDAGLITAVTNRIGRREQVVPGAPAGHDMLEHRAFGAAQRDRYGAALEDITDGPVISGLLMCLSQQTWRAMGGFADGMMGVDNEAHRSVRRIGKRVYLMRGLYLWHLYRADGIGHTNAPRAKRK